jgi:L-ascorbate metabolism protein UlaG (beta-lactamase superfamily)
MGDLRSVPTQAEIEALGTVHVALVPVGGGTGLNAAKAAEVVRDEFVDSQALAFIHYNPKNIVKRMKFVETLERQDVAGPNSVPADNNRTDK